MKRRKFLHRPDFCVHRSKHGFTVLELVITAAIFAGIVAIGLVWLLAQQRFAAATGTRLEQAGARAPLVTLLRQDIQAAGAVVPIWQGLVSDEHTLILAIPQDAYGYRTDGASIILYARTGNRLLRSAELRAQNEELSPSSSAFIVPRSEFRDARWIGPELKTGQDIRFTYLDRDGLALAGSQVTLARQVVVTLPAVPGQPASTFRVHLRNTLP